MMACIIMHNMIKEDESSLKLEAFHNWNHSKCSTMPQFSFCEIQVRTRQIESLDNHYALRNYLINHLWALKW